MSRLCTQTIAIAGEKQNLRNLLAKMASNYSTITSAEILRSGEEASLSAMELQSRFSSVLSNDDCVPVVLFGEEHDEQGDGQCSFELHAEGQVWVMEITFGIWGDTSSTPQNFCSALDSEKFGWAINDQVEDEDFELVYQTGEGRVVFVFGDLQEGDPESFGRLTKAAYDWLASDEGEWEEWDDLNSADPSLLGEIATTAGYDSVRELRDYCEYEIWVLRDIIEEVADENKRISFRKRVDAVLGEV